jgi:hypothetical protein
MAVNDPTAPPETLDGVEKNPDAWVTGDEKMTGPQASYLETLKREASEDFDPTLSKADASKEIDRLQEETGRGADS